jgi:hypothetical protein
MDSWTFRKGTESDGEGGSTPALLDRRCLLSIWILRWDAALPNNVRGNVMKVSPFDTVGYGTGRMSLRKRVKGNMQPDTVGAWGQSTLCTAQVSLQGPVKTACIPCIIRHCTHATHRRRGRALIAVRRKLLPKRQLSPNEDNERWPLSVACKLQTHARWHQQRNTVRRSRSGSRLAPHACV